MTKLTRTTSDFSPALVPGGRLLLQAVGGEFLFVFAVEWVVKAPSR